MEKIKDGNNFDVAWQPQEGERMLSIVDNGNATVICAQKDNFINVYARGRGESGFRKLTRDAVGNL
jgi:hypothetical protein